MNRYENHEDEWKEEDNKARYEREQAKKQYWVDPRDPNYIAPERKCTECGTEIEDLLEEFTTCDSCFFTGI